MLFLPPATATPLIFNPPLFSLPTLGSNVRINANRRFPRFRTCHVSDGRTLCIPWGFAQCQNFTDAQHRTSSVHSTILLHFAAPAVLFFVGLGSVSACTVGGSLPTPPSSVVTTTLTEEKGVAESLDLGIDQKDLAEDNEEMERSFGVWKTKKFALTVPLRVVALRGSFPPSWIKEFTQSQSRRAKVSAEFRRSPESIFSELGSSSKKGSIGPKSAMAADIVSLGDSWLNYAINDGLIEPMHEVKNQSWLNDLSDAWKVFLRRNNKGELDPNGKIWGVPYRCGCLVIAYKKNKFVKMGLAPIEDWADLWKSDLTGKISMIDSPREVVGAALKYMGASYNTKDVDSQVPGGKSSVMQNLKLLQRQVKLFDSTHYLKAFSSGDVWVAVGWSSDVIPTAKRMSNVAVIVPKSGSSLWVDLWAIPAATRFDSSQIGGRVRGPSPLINQWIDFCLQPGRSFPFKQGMLPGFSPNALQLYSNNAQEDVAIVKTGNGISEMPSPDILARCEFLEPLSEKALMDYRWLVSQMEMPTCNGISLSFQHFLSKFQRFLSNYGSSSS
ncbi:Spermidine/putrescine abc transporter, spermidine/putrescine-bindingprotein [Zostera marina]|uniref:Spermidine/putrescine abc transporter, spermidine/putrescine-bindingprotein n=1 Tax=Zostera marina TaxID=29655 RepID=A0A0K9Q619_ZOSMR|nr:Spermidine/putrescine abc transporter, spermidine/putrescine-bindingprotein [Zostera marina]